MERKKLKAVVGVSAMPETGVGWPIDGELIGALTTHRHGQGLSYQYFYRLGFANEDESNRM